jgi:diphosphomevalonate decarboxylase
MMSEPPIFYWNDKTFSVMESVRQMREEGLLAYYTMDAGANVHVILEKANEIKVLDYLKKIDGVIQVIVAHPGEGAKVL